MNAVGHYFAFGSNMDAERVRERGLRTGTPFGGWLDGFRLAFNKAGRAHPGCGHANLVHSPGDRLEGVLYPLADPSQILRMDPFESAPVNYSRDVFLVHSAGGPVAAWTYVANPAVLVEGLLPDRAYLAHLLAGATLLSPAYVEVLRAWRTG